MENSCTICFYNILPIKVDFRYYGEIVLFMIVLDSSNAFILLFILFAQCYTLTISTQKLHCCLLLWLYLVE